MMTRFEKRAHLFLIQAKTQFCILNLELGISLAAAIPP